MYDASEPRLMQKIDGFLSRKAQQYPELKLTERWDEYEMTPKRRSFGIAQPKNTR